MKVVILAGGKGTRLSEETATIPKPMLMVGAKPLLQHVMDIYRAQGLSDFIIPVGYKGEQVFGYFYSLGPEKITLLRNGTCFEWEGVRVSVVNTGEETQTGGRLLRIAHLIGRHKFHFTYGDGLGDVDLHRLEAIGLGSYDDVTLTTVRPDGRFGRAVVTKHGRVWEFGEKVENETEWINGGFAILSPFIFEGVRLLGGDKCNLEKDLYPTIAKHGYMSAMQHTGYWKCVDTLRDLEDLRRTYYKEGAVWLM